MRHGGVSSGKMFSLNCGERPEDHVDLVEENRRRAMGALGVEQSVLMIPRLAHGDNVLVINTPSKWPQIRHVFADGIICTAQNAVLGITYADCLPILLATDDQSIVAAVHAGWRGVRSGVIYAAIKHMRKLCGCSTIYAAIGPTISQSGFLVTGDVFAYFQQTWPIFVRDHGEGGLVDLTSIAIKQLADVGVSAEKVGGFTDLDERNYFSHRRDQGISGRHIALIAIMH
jgi:YfiH family protein